MAVRPLSSWVGVCRLGVAVAAALALAGCEPDATPGDFQPQVLDAVSGGDSITSADVSASASLSGTWMLATDWSTCVEIPETPTELRTYKLLKVKIVQDGLKLTETREVCSVTNTAILGQITVFPEALIKTFAVQTIQSSIFGFGLGAGYTSGLDEQTVGVQLTDPLGEEMPTDTNDPRLVDQEKDGHVGATLLVGKICQAYVASRALSTLSGTLVAPGRIEGKGHHETTQSFLDGSSPFCTQSFPTPANQAGSVFAMQRVGEGGLDFDFDDDGEVTCAEIIQGQATQPILTWVAPDNTTCGAEPP